MFDELFLEFKEERAVDMYNLPFIDDLNYKVDNKVIYLEYKLAENDLTIKISSKIQKNATDFEDLFVNFDLIVSNLKNLLFQFILADKNINKVIYNNTICNLILVNKNDNTFTYQSKNQKFASFDFNLNYRTYIDFVEHIKNHQVIKSKYEFFRKVL